MTSPSVPNVVRLPRRSSSAAWGDQPVPLSPFALPVYRLLVEHGRLGTAEMAALLSLQAADTMTAIADLESLHLVRRYGNGYVAVPREQAADEIYAEQAERLSEALDGLSVRQRRLTTLFQHRNVLDEDLSRGVRQVSLGTDEVRELFEMPADAHQSLFAIHPGGVFDVELLERSLDSARENLRRGVRLRAIHQTSVLAHPRMVAYLTELTREGGHVRLRNNLPTRLLLIDGSSAVCSLPTGDGAMQTFMMSGMRVVALLSQMFESTWLDAMPLSSALNDGPRGPVTRPSALESVAHGSGDLPQPRHGVSLNALQESILRQLAEGHTDQSIARALGITTRTVTRRVSEIYELLGVESRFQAGVVAKSMGVV